MGIVEYEKNRLRQQEIEVRALVALLNWGTTTSESMNIKKECVQKLYDIAFPDKLAQKINQTQFGLE